MLHFKLFVMVKRKEKSWIEQRDVAVFVLVTTSDLFKSVWKSEVVVDDGMFAKGKRDRSGRVLGIYISSFWAISFVVDTRRRCY